MSEIEEYKKLRTEYVYLKIDILKAMLRNYSPGELSILKDAVNGVCDEKGL